MQEAFFPNVALSVLVVDFLRYFLIAGLVWLVVNVALSERLAHRRILQATPKSGQILHEITYSVATTLIFASVGMLIFLEAQAGNLQIYDSVAAFGWVWWAASLVLIVVAHDAYFYWVHRWLHHKAWFSSVHGRHHASRHPTPWAAYAFHPVEAIVQAAFFPLYLAIVPTHDAVMLVFVLHMTLRNAIGHCSHEVFPWAATPRGFFRWITPVTHHHFHHAHNQGNFGLYFTWWDQWCGTEDPDYLAYGDHHFVSSPSPKPTHAASHGAPS